MELLKHWLFDFASQYSNDLMNQCRLVQNLLEDLGDVAGKFGLASVQSYS